MAGQQSSMALGQEAACLALRLRLRLPAPTTFKLQPHLQPQRQPHLHSLVVSGEW